jgi:DNA-binding CsgD family transcriptional regulator
MKKAPLMPRIAEIIGKIGEAGFPVAMRDLLCAVSPYSYTVIFAYNGNAKPIDLFDDFPSDRQQVFVGDYQDGPYLLDPFYLAATQPIASGLYRMRDLAPDRFYQGEYFRSYYGRTGLAEEVGFFIAMPGGSTVVLSLMRDDKPFSNRDLRALEQIRPVVEASLRAHWPQLALKFAAAAPSSGAATDSGIERSFQSFGEGILTPREREIVEFTLKGHSPDATGRILGIAPGTVRIHRRNIYAKLQINSQGELFSRFIETLGTVQRT